MDCLAVTGSNPTPLAMMAVAMIAVAVVLLVAVRRARRDRSGRSTRPGAARTGVAVTTMAVLTVTAGGGLSLLGTSTAQAATGSCVTRPSTASTTDAATTTDSGSTTADGSTTDPAAEQDPASELPATPDETTPTETTPEETTPDETTPDESAPDGTTPEETTPDEDAEVLPAADVFALALPVDSQPNLWSAVATEQRTLVLSRLLEENDGESITVEIPDQADGYWVATDLLDADGSTATDVTVTREAGATRFTIATQPEDSRT
ncbi:MAG TPA: hypothetical protein VGC67_13610, partial [Cellulomonas sp.]